MTMFQKITINILILVLSFLFSYLLSPSLNKDYKPFQTPELIGELNSIEIYSYLGDIVIPNQIKNEKYINPNLTFWDSYIITAPVPYFQSGYIITPWTILPINVVRTIDYYDSTYADNVEEKLGLNKPIKQRKFNSLTKIDIPQNTIYGQLSKLNSIYAINLFEFEKDFGKNYKSSLKKAISNSLKYSIEIMGQDREKSIAIPALAGAKNVVEKNLVISYYDSFSSILSGIKRVKGNAPSKIILVVYYGLHNKDEYESAITGLQNALRGYVDNWKKKIKQINTTLIFLSYFLGIWFFIRKHRVDIKRNKNLMGYILSSIFVLGLSFISSDLVKNVFEIIPYNRSTHLIIGLLSILIFNLSYFLSKIRVIDIEING